MRTSVVLALGALSVFPMAAAAQDAPSQAQAGSCICEVPLQTRGSVAILEDVGGRVLLTASHGYARASPGAELAVGDQVIVTNEGRAVLSAGGTCRVGLGSPSLVRIVAAGNRACIAQTSLTVSVEPAQAPPGQLLSGVQGGGLSGAGFFAGLGAFLAAKGVSDGAAARNLDEVLPVSP